MDCKEDGEIVVISPLEALPSDAGITVERFKKSKWRISKKLGLEATAAKLRGQTGTQVIVEIEIQIVKSKKFL